MKRFLAWVGGSGLSWWHAPLILLGIAVAVLLLNVMVPYQPFAVRSYVIHPQKVCTGGEVTAEVTRAFTSDFASLELEETWVTVRDVAGIPPGRPVSTHEGALPRQALRESGGFRTVASPLITEAPRQPGVYRVRVHAVFRGSRFGFGVLQTVGEVTFSSTNTVTVVDCRTAPQGDL